MRTKKVLERAQEQEMALTFDDVTLQSGYSEVLPKDVALPTLFSRNVGLKIPIVSAAMDTVTERKLAIELAMFGGLGVIHKNLSTEEQAEEVSRVKHHLSGLIEKPICIYDDEKISVVLQRREKKGYGFHSFPVLNRENKLIGIVTKTDFDFSDDSSQLIRKIMTAKILTAKEGTEIERAYEIMEKKKRKVLPLINDKNEVKGMYVFSDVKRIIIGSAEIYNLDSKGRLRVGAAIGVGKEGLERASRLLEEQVSVLVIDTAHGDTKSVIETLEKLKENCQVDIVVGNISNPDSVQRLIDANVDGLKVGQGPGGICTTRVVAGVGMPQVSAVYECTKIADKHGIPICADGGLKSSGDIVKAIAAGAHSVMLGTMLAGTEEAPGDIIFLEGRQWKTYRGMGSLGAMQEYRGSRVRYQQQTADKDKLVPEGVEGLVPYRGKLAEIIFQYVGGVRSGMGYVGASNIRELREKGDFRRITSHGVRESHPHDVRITKDAPNYPVSRGDN